MGLALARAGPHTPPPMARVTVEDCLDQEENRFALVILAATRTRQLMKGARLVCDLLDAAAVKAATLDSFMLQDPGEQAAYRDIVILIEHELTARLQKPGLPERPSRGRMSRQVKHFPISPEVSIRPDEAGRHHVLSLTAADRPGLLYDVAAVLAEHGIRLHTAKIATLGERVEDTFLLTGNVLNQDAQVLRIERELLERLQV